MSQPRVDFESGQEVADSEHSNKLKNYLWIFGITLVVLIITFTACNYPRSGREQSTKTSAGTSDDSKPQNLIDVVIPEEGAHKEISLKATSACSGGYTNINNNNWGVLFWIRAPKVKKVLKNWSETPETREGAFIILSCKALIEQDEKRLKGEPVKTVDFMEIERQTKKFKDSDVLVQQYEKAIEYKSIRETIDSTVEKLPLESYFAESDALELSFYAKNHGPEGYKFLTDLVVNPNDAKDEFRLYSFIITGIHDKPTYNFHMIEGMDGKPIWYLIIDNVEYRLAEKEHLKALPFANNTFYQRYRNGVPLL